MRAGKGLTLVLTLLVLLATAAPAFTGISPAAARSAPLSGGQAIQAGDLPASLPLAGPQAPQACSTPFTQGIRGKNVTFDQCYERTFSYGGTSYTIQVYYTETDSATNTSQCTAAENSSGRCEHAIANNDDANGNNLTAVAMGAEAEQAMRFYVDRNLPFLPGGQTTLRIFFAEDPRLGGTPTCASINVDDDWTDNNDILQKRILAFHEIQHLIQCNYLPGGNWYDFYGEGIARAIEDRVDNALDADTGHLFIPEVNGILSSDSNRSSDLSTINYRSVLWWTWLMDQYRQNSETAPVLGWPAIRDFYITLGANTDQLKALRDFIASRGSTFRQDFTDYTLALYAYPYTSSKPRLDFLDSEINTVTGGLSGHTVTSGGPPFSSSSVMMNPRSSRYFEFSPANQCKFIAFTFNGNGKAYSFSVMTVGSTGSLQKQWTSYSTSWARTVGTNLLNRVVGVVTAIDDSGNVNIGRGCVSPTVKIKNPTTAQFEMVGLASSPRNFIVRLSVKGEDGSSVAGLTANDFLVQLRKAGTTGLINATILNSTYVQDDYWLLVKAPTDAQGAQDGQFYDLIVTLGANNDTQNSAVLYVPRSQDVIVVLDRSGSMGGTTGKLDAARNAANLLVNELADTDQGGYVAFDTNAVLREPLAVVGSGAGSHRSDLAAKIGAETVGATTAIGKGMETAATEHDTHKIATNMCSFVLLSDGYENEIPYWNDVKANVADNGCAIHTVALGPDANEVLMQQIAAAVPGGSFDYADSSGSVPLRPQAADAILGWQNNLSRIYDFKASQIAGRQRLQTHKGTGRDQGLTDYKFFVDDASQKLVVSIAWQYDSKGVQEIRLLDPSGNMVSPALAGTNASQASAIRRISPLGTNEVWEVEKPVQGFWTLQVGNLFQEYFVSATAESAYELYLFIGTPVDQLSQGVQVPILATFVGPDKPLLGADVSARIVEGDGSVRTLKLFDDGSHSDGEADDGVYGNVYLATKFADGSVAKPPPEGEAPQVVGSYKVYVTGIKGDLRREAQGSFAIETGRDDNQNRLPDGWEATYGVNDPSGDEDGDKLTNYCEFQAGTDPRNSDTDGGGESDGSEAPKCYVDPNGKDPLNPQDDFSGRLSGFRGRAALNLKTNLPLIELLWGDPVSGTLAYVNIYRRVFATPSATPTDWLLVASQLTGSGFQDSDIQVGSGYQYRLEPFVGDAPGQNSPQAIFPATVEESNVVIGSSDPYPPGGSILINNGERATITQVVTLTLSADDFFGDSDGSPVVEYPGTPAEQLQMRISNSPDFIGAQWQPYQAVVTGWDLGNLPYNSVATVYVQFKDAAGNVSEAGLGLSDTIVFKPSIFLPLVKR